MLHSLPLVGLAPFPFLEHAPRSQLHSIYHRAAQILDLRDNYLDTQDTCYPCALEQHTRAHKVDHCWLDAPYADTPLVARDLECWQEFHPNPPIPPKGGREGLMQGQRSTGQGS